MRLVAALTVAAALLSVSAVPVHAHSMLDSETSCLACTSVHAPAVLAGATSPPAPVVVATRVEAAPVEAPALADAAPANPRAPPF